jgi:vancomycin permeability regulator SanA
MMLKTFIIISYLLLLNGCAQSTSFLGPIIAGASSGSVHQAALSYGSNKAITQITGKTPAENFKIFLTTSKEIESENANNFFKTIKKLNENSSVKNLANQ